jgi:endonuclease/exonuclease/phosphatase family metal-dependent hydrolase
MHWVFWIIMLLVFNTTQSQDVKLLSLNIRYDHPADGEFNWRYRKQQMAEWIKDSVSPDIICLQEVLFHQLTFLDSAWKGQFSYYGKGREDGEMKGEFSPIFFRKDRYELVRAVTHWLSPTPLIPSKGWDAACERILTIVWLLDKGSQDTLCVFNTHWDHVGSEARRNSALFMIKEFNKIPQNIEFYAAGDFNAGPENEALIVLQDTWRNLTPAEIMDTPTFSGFKMNTQGFQRIDYIWTRKENDKRYRFTQKRSLNTLPFISDHDAIWIQSIQ